MEKSIYFFFQGTASKGLINSQIIIKTMVIFGKKTAKNGSGSKIRLWRDECRKKKGKKKISNMKHFKGL